MTFVGGEQLLKRRKTYHLHCSQSWRYCSQRRPRTVRRGSDPCSRGYALSPRRLLPRDPTSRVGRGKSWKNCCRTFEVLFQKTQYAGLADSGGQFKRTRQNRNTIQPSADKNKISGSLLLGREATEGDDCSSEFLLLRRNRY
jgi:hypothetical protein